MSTEAKAPTTGTSTRFKLRVALLVSLAIFAQESVWNFYDAQVPATLREYTSSAALIGLIMGMDNILGIFIQPWIGHLSDRTRTRWGRRTPFIVVGVPIAALLFALIPHATTFPILILFIFLFALTANTFKPVNEALVADFQAPQHRSKASAIAKIATSLTIIVSSLISLLVVDRSVQLAFAIPAILLVLGATIVVLGLREAKRPEYRELVATDSEVDNSSNKLSAVLRELVMDRDHSRVIMILVIVVTAATWSALRAQLTVYGMETLGLTRGQAGGFTLPAGIAFIVVAFPIALLSDKVGRRRIIHIGLFIFVAGTIVGFVSHSYVGTMAAVVITAVGYAAFSVNAVVIMWNLSPSARTIGTYTGIYSVSVAIGSSVGPGFVGLLIDRTGWQFMMLHAALLACISIVLLFFVKREYAPGLEPVSTKKLA
jgi:MFS family permease